MKIMDMVRGIITNTAEGVLRKYSGTGRVGEIIANRRYMSHFGLINRPPDGAEGVFIRDGQVIICLADDYREGRISGEKGESGIYNIEGDYILLELGKTIKIYTGGKLQIDAETEVEINTPKCAIVSPVVELSDGAFQRLIDERFKTLFDAHTHSGVTVGSGTTGTPPVPLNLDSCATTKTKAA